MVMLAMQSMISLIAMIARQLFCAAQFEILNETFTLGSGFAEKISLICTPSHSLLPTATPALKRHPTMRQNCSALPSASLSGEGSGEGCRGQVFAVEKALTRIPIISRVDFQLIR